MSAEFWGLFESFVPTGFGTLVSLIDNLVVVYHTMPSARKKSSAPQQSVSDEGEASTSVAHRRRNLRGRRGSLEDLPKMPLDILFEVCRVPALVLFKNCMG